MSKLENINSRRGSFHFIGIAALLICVAFIGFPSVIGNILGQYQQYLVAAVTVVLVISAFLAFGSLLKSAVLLSIWLGGGFLLLNSTGNLGQLSNVAENSSVKMFNSEVDDSQLSKFDIIKKTIAETDYISKFKEQLGIK